MPLVSAVARRRLLTRAVFGGGSVLHVVAFAFQPAVYLKRMSMTRGFRGSSMAWKIVGVAVYTPSTFKRFFGKQPESLGKFRVGSGGFVRVANTKPVSRKERKRLGLSKEVLVAQAIADVEAARPGKGVRVK